jgi:hypothetical protein
MLILRSSAAAWRASHSAGNNLTATSTVRRLVSVPLRDDADVPSVVCGPIAVRRPSDPPRRELSMITATLLSPRGRPFANLSDVIDLLAIGPERMPEIYVSKYRSQCLTNSGPPRHNLLTCPLPR